MNRVRPFIAKALQKTGLNRLAHRLYYAYVHGFDTASPGLREALAKAFDAAGRNGLANVGDYCEFGLFKGYSFWFAQDQARGRGFDRMRFFGFDSFAGLPAVRGVDCTRNDDFYQGQYACSREQVVRNLDSKGVDWQRTFLTEGYYDDVLNEQTRRTLGLEKVAIALIDCDLYASTACVLHFLRDHMINGTILIMDDWNCFDRDDERGQRRALGEFLQAHPALSVEELASYGAYGQMFIVRCSEPQDTSQIAGQGE